MKLKRLFLLPVCAMSAFMFTSCEDELEDRNEIQQEVRSTPYQFLKDFEDHVEYELGDGILGSNWMSKVPDDTKVCKLSIPGTHDALTGMGFYNPQLQYIFNMTAISQVSTLYEQLESGIRFFDIRPVVSIDTVNHEKILRCTHGISELSVTFEDALDMMGLYLKEHPKEFVIVKTQADSGVENQVDWGTLMLTFLAEYDDEHPGLFAEWRPGLTMGEVRGKILFINRKPFLGMYGSFCEWPDEDADLEEVVDPEVEMSQVIGKAEAEDIFEDFTTMYVQDYYKTTTDFRMEIKKLAVLNMLNEARYCTADPDDNTWIVNHCSAYTEVSPRGYVNNAAVIHPLVIEDILKHPKEPVGIVAIDFACYDNVSVIINGYTPYTSFYLYDKKPMSQSLTNLLIMSNFK